MSSTQALATAPYRNDQDSESQTPRVLVGFSATSVDTPPSTPWRAAVHAYQVAKTRAWPPEPSW